jgi:hypothetical protein
MLTALQERVPADMTLTAILKENAPARRLLEAGHRGLPRYEAIAKIHNYTLSTARWPGKQKSTGTLPQAAAISGKADGNEVTTFLEAQFRLQDGAPVDNPFDTSAMPAAYIAGALRREDFMVVRRGGAVVAAGGLWDQRAVRQLVVTQYARALGYARPFVNLWRQARGQGMLPRPGNPLNIAYVSHLAVAPGDDEAFEALIKGLAASAAARRIDYLVLSLAAAHPFCKTVATWSSYKVESILYTVHGTGGAGRKLSTIPYIEAGLL